MPNPVQLNDDIAYAMPFQLPASGAPGVPRLKSGDKHGAAGHCRRLEDFNRKPGRDPQGEAHPVFDGRCLVESSMPLISEG